jgi:hypothetical protein
MLMNFFTKLFHKCCPQRVEKLYEEGDNAV